MPAAMKLLSPNARYHWSERSRRSAGLKQAAWAMAISRKVPPLERASVVVEYQPPDRRRRDADNAAAASGKPCIDGLVAAGVLADDESPRFVIEVTYRIGPVHPGGRLVLHITEVTP
jgi:crossover junction endodeoxyribonuclease RusA